MKGQRRRELQQNELADWIVRLIDRVRPHLKTFTIVALVALAVGGATALWLRHTAAEDAQAWDELCAELQKPPELQRPAELERMAERHEGTDAAAWALVAAADSYLAIGCQQLFVNKAEAAQELQKAVENYLTVLEETSRPELLERATFGLARAYEALAGTRQGQGELKRAIEYYQKLTATWPDGVYAQLAAQRLEDLQRDETKAFYDEFAKFDPKPAFSPAESSQGPVFDPSQVPDQGEIPDVLGDLMPPGQGPAESPAPGSGETAGPAGEKAEESPGREGSSQADPGSGEQQAPGDEPQPSEEGQADRASQPAQPVTP